MKKLTVLTGIGKVVFFNDAGYTHGNIVYNVNEVKDGLSIGTIKSKIFLLGTLNPTTNLIVDGLRSGSNLFYLTLLVVIIFSVAFAFETKRSSMAFADILGKYRIVTRK